VDEVGYVGATSFMDEPTADEEQAALACFDDAEHVEHDFETFVGFGGGVELLPVHSFFLRRSGSVAM